MGNSFGVYLFMKFKKIAKVMTARKIHIYLLAFLGVSAIGGGGALIISPSGKLLGGLPLSILKNSPFNDF